MKIRYVNCCILSFRIISCCFQFIQVCSSLTCRHCWRLSFNSRTNVINDGITTSCITSCIFERYDYVVCSHIITSRAINVCCISAIWAFNNFVTIFICINSWSNSVNSISCSTCCTIRCGCNSYVVTSFYNSTKFSNFFLAIICDVGKILFSNACNLSCFC